MKKILVCALALIMMCFLSVGLTACGGGDSGGGDTDSGNKEYVADTDIDNVIAGPDDYKGKYIKLTGKIYSVDKKGSTIAIQCYHDVENSNREFMAYMDTEDSFKEGDYVNVDGKIEGKVRQDNEFGIYEDCLQIAADSIVAGPYQEIIAPAKTTKDEAKDVETNDVTFTVSKVEYAETETRIYLAVKNDSSDKVSVYSTLAKVVQDGKQYETEFNYLGDYPEIDEVVAGASADGIVAVKPLDPEKEAELILEPLSDNYEVEFGEVKIKF